MQARRKEVLKVADNTDKSVKAPVLDVQELGIDFGGLTAVNDLNMQVYDGEIVGLIGPNGAGKTTVFNLLTKVYKPTRGKIYFDGKDTAGKSVVDINKAGIARTFQNIRLFGNLTVLDNVKTGFHNVIPYSPITAILRLPKYFSSEKEINEKAMDLLKIMELDKYADYKASNLPYGAQRRLEIARALATNPKLLLLDEPAAGMNPQETAELMDMIRFVRDHFKIAVLLIEHDMKLVMGICERITVLNYGMMLAQGTPEEIQSNPKVTDLKVKYGMIEAIKGISFEVRDGEIVTMIGANGAGKTTTMHAISGLVKAAEGSIKLDDVELTKTPANKIVGMGLAQVPEGRRVFAEQTVEENLILGAYLRKDKAKMSADMEEVYQLFPRLKERRKQLAGTLSGGEQQMLAMGRALMAKPSILLLDEPSMGLSPLLVSEIFHIIREINDKGTTILLVEQNAKRALAIADRAYVLETGNITLEGTGEELANDERVQKAYLGG